MKNFTQATFILLLLLATWANTFGRPHEEDDFLPNKNEVATFTVVNPLPCSDVLLLDTTYSYTYVGGQWQPTNRSVFLYNTDGQLIEEYQYQWEPALGSWRNDKYYTYTYNAAGEMVTRYRHDWRVALGYWENEYWYDNTYDGLHRRTSSIRKDWNATTATWVNAEKFTYSYQGNTESLTQRILQIWNGTTWVNNTRYTYTNNVQGIRTENAIYNWIGGLWQLNSRYLYTYNANNCLALRTYQVWNGVSWLLDSKNEYTYNADGYETQNIKSNSSGSNWTLATKETSVWKIFDAAPTSTVLSNDTFNSNDPIGTLVGNFTTIDPDDNAFTYSLVAGNGSNDQNNSQFTIAGNQLFTNFNFSNYGSSTLYIYVKIEDGRGAVCYMPFVLHIIFPINVSIAAAGPFCENEGMQILSAIPAGGNWGGAANAVGQVNPAALGLGTFNVTYTYTSPNGASGSTQTSITILAAPVANIQQPTAFCENNGVQTLNASPPGGIWGGVANAAGQVNPSLLGAGTHPVSYTYTAQNGCTSTAQINLVVNALPTVSITPSGPFCENDAVQTLTATPVGGTWGGASSATGQINPALLGTGSHNVTYTYISNGCTETVQETVVINAKPIVNILQVGSFCKNDEIQTLSATPSNGVWSGDVNANGQLDPALLASGTHSATYSATNSLGCAAQASVNFTINELPTATISGSGTLCENSGEVVPLTIQLTGNGGFTLNCNLNGIPIPPINAASSPNTFLANAPGTYEVVEVIDANGCTNSGMGTGLVTGVGSPVVGNLGFACDATNSSYTVSFEISGGDALSYSVSGGGVLNNSAPYIFTSDPLPNGSLYAFTVEDANNCAPVTLSGSHLCDCTSKAGTMNPVGATVCEGETAVLLHNLDETLDGNDTLLFVLHNGSATALGTVLMTNNTPQFVLSPPLQAGVTYFVAAVVGDKQGNTIDFNDPCLSISFGAPVRFNSLPTVLFDSDTTICSGETTDLVFNLTGNGPFDVTYSDGSGNFSLNNIFDGYQLPVSPSSSTIYTLLGVTDSSIPACSSLGGNSSTIAVNPTTSSTQQLEICQGESVVLGGILRTNAGIYTDTFNTVSGCDSIVTTTLVVNELDTTYLFGTSCDPGQAGVFQSLMTNQNGCDSLVIETITFFEADTTYFNTGTCDPSQAGTSIEIFTAQAGCDSVVISTAILLPSDTTILFAQTCNPPDTGATATIFSNQYGCDSLVLVITSLLATPLASVESLTNYNGFDISCAGSANGKAKVVVAGNSPTPFDFLWSNGSESPILSDLGPGTYDVTVTAANGCTSSAAIALSEPPALSLDFTVKNVGCNAANDGEINALAGGGVGGYQFSLNDGDHQSDPLFAGLMNAAYKVEVQDANGCEVSLVAVVDSTGNVLVDLGPDQTIQLGESAVLIISTDLTPADIVTVTWMGLVDPPCPSCLEQTITPSFTKTYTATILGNNGCSGTSSVTVVVEDGNGGGVSLPKNVYAPNAFSPNGDGVNDHFTIFGGESAQTVLELKVFSRQGQLVFAAQNFLPNDPELGWDGTFDGHLLDAQEYTFFAAVQFLDGSEELIKGGVTLVK